METQGDLHQLSPETNPLMRREVLGLGASRQKSENSSSILIQNWNSQTFPLTLSNNSVQRNINSSLRPWWPTFLQLSFATHSLRRLLSWNCRKEEKIGHPPFFEGTGENMGNRVKTITSNKTQSIVVRYRHRATSVSVLWTHCII
jgi:hypothetical protein